MSSPQPQIPGLITNASEAEKAIANLEKIMDQLEHTVTEETAHVRAGRLRNALGADAAKVELARLYAAESDRVKTAKAVILQSLPEALERLRQRHDTFQELLQTNLTVLATAHAVAEGIIRGVSSELARKQVPSTYGASGRANVTSAKASQPIAFSRAL
jgi:hypothetical protein